MLDDDYGIEKSFQRVSSPPEILFDDLWPSETYGDGQLVANNSNTGAAQGKSNMIRKAHCRLCGFPNDASSIDHTGGSLDGNGAGGAITNTTSSWTLPNGTTATETYGTQAYNMASGCALCFSKNSMAAESDVEVGDPWNKNPIATGF